MAAAKERLWLSSDISLRARCSIYATGEIGTEEIDNLIELLGITRRIHEKSERADPAALSPAREVQG